MPVARVSVVVALLAGLFATGTAVTRAQQAPVRAEPAEATEVSAVVVDVVVRDRQGNPVTDLRPDEVALYEDGIRQELGAFVPILRDVPESRRPATPTPTPSPHAAASAPEVVAFVFDRLSPEARALATQAAQTYVGEGRLADNTIAIFGVDLSLHLYQAFTRDAAALREALAQVGQRSTSPFGTTGQQQNATAAEAQQARDAVDAATAAAGGPGASPDVAAGAATAQFATMQSRMLQRFDSLERDQQGYATSNALLAIVSALRAVPGRKTLVFFSEGLSIPPSVQAQFVSVIDAANRANVSIYPMDAAGLRTESTILQTRQGVQAASAATLGRDPSGDVVGRPMTEALERNEDLLRADPQSGLSQLADQTGGFLIANSNDLRSGFARIDSDMRNYYLLTYVPTRGEYDGRFRTIDVRVSRPNVRVSARKGYFAVRPSATGAPVLTYETAPLAALERTPLPNAFPVRAIVLRFPERDRPGLVPVLVNVPMAGMGVEAREMQPGFRSDVIVLVQFKDEAGQVIDKMSQRYQIEGEAGEEDGAARGEILFYREPVLGSGVYTMETVVYDAVADKASVRISTIDVEAPRGDALRMSSIMAVARSEVVPAAERVPGSPLYVGERLLYPLMNTSLDKATTQELAFYFVAYPRPGGGPVSATLDLVRNGTRLAQVPVALTEPDASGRIAQLGRLPLGPLPAGRFDLLVTVTQDAATVSQRLVFRLEP